MNGLRELIKGPVVLPGDPGWDIARGAWHLPYLLLFGGFVPDPALGPVVGAAIERVQTTMAPWITDRVPPNFSAGEPNAKLYPAMTQTRLAQIKSRVDPKGVIRGNHPVS